jgi:hypothetical protein
MTHNISNYLIDKEIKKLREKLEDDIKPNLVKCSEVFDGEITSPLVKEYIFKEIKDINRRFDPNKLFSYLDDRCGIIDKQITVLHKFIQDSSSTAVVRATITMQQAVILKYIALVDNFINTTRGLMVTISSMEINHIKRRDTPKSTVNYVKNQINPSLKTLMGFCGYVNRL